MDDGQDLVTEIEALGTKLADAKASIERRFIGQPRVVDLVLSAILCGGHGLLIGLPGLGKTRLVDTLSTVLGLDGARVQFTPDLMPADILGSEVLETGADGSRAFKFIEGPIFCQLLMADEINRASPRTQSALLQAMQEKSVTIAGQPHPLPVPFHVLATQNPIEQEGTYPLPEAQLDRFLLHVEVGYPTPEDERRILVLNRDEAKSQERDAFQPPELLSAESVFNARQEILRLHLADELEQYIVNVVTGTRDAGTVDPSLEGQIQYGASPRASMGIDRAARAHAWPSGPT